MAKAHVQEYAALDRMYTGSPAPLAREPAVATQAVTFTTSTQSSAFNADTQLVRIVADAACHLAFGANPTATANSMLLPSGAVEYFAVTPGHKVAIYDGTSS